MKTAVITIGNELLTGKTINTNSSWISKKLQSYGCLVLKHETIDDNKEFILDSLDHLFSKKYDLIICTGGLGPTDDDVTRKTIFEFFSSNEIFDEDYWVKLKDKFKRIGSKIPISNKSQALIPHNGKVFSNPLGSARGIFYEKNNTVLIALPGIPREMEFIMKNSVIPWVKNNTTTKNYFLNIKTTGIAESSLYEIIKAHKIKTDMVNIGYYPSLYGVDLRITGKNLMQVEKIQTKISNVVKEYIYNIGEKEIESVLVKKLMNNKLSISIAESCTGGLIGHRITKIDGSSAVFYGGLVAYRNNIKINNLKIDKDIIDKYGAVSREVAKEMAINIKNEFQSDIGLSTTGIAGPSGGSKQKPVGLVYIGLAIKDTCITKKYNFSSDRDANKVQTSQAALCLVLKNIKNYDK